MAIKSLINTELKDLEKLSNGNWLFTSYRGWSQQRSSADIECVFRRLRALPEKDDVNFFIPNQMLTNEYSIVCIHLGTLPRLQPLSVWSGKQPVFDRIGAEISGEIDFSKCKFGTLDKLYPDGYKKLSNDHKGMLLKTNFLLAPIKTNLSAKYAIINCTEVFRRHWAPSSALAKAFVRTTTESNFSHIFHVIEETDESITIKLNQNMNTSDEKVIGLFSSSPQAQRNIQLFSKSYHASTYDHLGLAFPKCFPFTLEKYYFTGFSLRPQIFDDQTIFINRLSTSSPVVTPISNKEVRILKNGVNTTGEDKIPTSFPPSDNKQRKKQNSNSKINQNVDDDNPGSNQNSSISIEVEPSIYNDFELNKNYIIPESKYQNDGTNGAKPKSNSSTISSRTPEKDSPIGKASFESEEQAEHIDKDSTSTLVSLDLFDTIVRDSTNLISSSNISTTYKKIYATTDKNYYLKNTVLSTFCLHFTDMTKKLMSWYYNNSFQNVYYFNPNTSKGQKINDLNGLEEPKKEVQRKLAVYELSNTNGTLYIYKIEPFPYPLIAFSYAIIYNGNLSKLSNNDLNYIFNQISKKRSLKIQGKGFLVKNIKHHLDKNINNCIEKNRNHLIESLPKPFLNLDSFDKLIESIKSKSNNSTDDSIADSITTT